MMVGTTGFERNMGLFVSEGPCNSERSENTPDIQVY
jgi:hypothetical protein